MSARSWENIYQKLRYFFLKAFWRSLIALPMVLLILLEIFSPEKRITVLQCGQVIDFPGRKLLIGRLILCLQLPHSISVLALPTMSILALLLIRIENRTGDIVLLNSHYGNIIQAASC